MIITPKNFGQQVLPKCQYFVPWISKTDQKRLKRQQLPFNMGRFCIMVARMMIFGFEEAPRVCYTLPKQSASYIQYFWKNHFSNNGKKSIFFQLFQTFHKDFSKDSCSKVIKSICFLVPYFILNYFKYLWYNSRKIQQIFS